MVNLYETLVNNRGTRERAVMALSENPTYRNSRLYRKMIAQSAHPFLGTDSLLLVTDYDFSFNMNTPESPDSLALAAFLEKNNVPVTTLSGNDKELQLAKFAKHGLPPTIADAIGVDVANGIWVLQDDEETWKMDEEWDRILKVERGFTYENMLPLSLDVMEQVQQRNLGHTGLRLQNLYSIPNILHHRPELASVIPEPSRTSAFSQEWTPTPSAPSQYKISFDYFLAPGEEPLAHEMYDQVSEMVHSVAPKVKLSTSRGDRVENGKQQYNLDILAASKDDGVDHLANTTGAIVADAGDSGNDEKMIFHMDNPNLGLRIVVGGYAPELERAIQALQIERQFGNQMKLTQDGKLLYIEASPHRKGPASIAHALRQARALWRLAAKAA